MKNLFVPIACGVLFAIQHPAGRLSGKVSIVLSVLILGGISLWLLPSIKAALKNVRNPWLASLFAVAAVLLFGRQCVEMAPGSFGAYLRVLFVFAAFALLALISKNSLQAATWLGVSVSVFTLMNLAGAALGISSDAMASTVELEGRMLFPFSAGMASFPCVVGVGLAAAVVGLRVSAGDRVQMAINAGTVAVCLLAGVLAGMRATLMIGALLFLLIDARGRLVKAGVIAAFLAMCVLPMLYVDMWVVPTADKLIPDFLQSSVERYSDELIFLNGRAYLYDYGFSLLATPYFPTFGMGFDGRDSSPMLVGQLDLWQAQGATSFHNGLLELLVINGSFLGTLATLLLCWVLVAVLRDGKGLTRASTASTVYGCIAAAPFLLSAMTAFVDEGFFLGTLLFCLLAPRVTAAAPAKISRLQPLRVPGNAGTALPANSRG